MAHLPLPSNPKSRGRPELRDFHPERSPYGCTPEMSLNGPSSAPMPGHVVLCGKRSDLEQEAAERQKQRAAEIEKQKKLDRETFLEEERRLIGMKTEVGDSEDFDKPSQAFLELMSRKQPNKSMRLPARPLCMLQAHEYTPPSDDYAELSRFLRLSTMPGHSSNDHVSEYRGSHNMEVWDGQKDLDRQAFKMKRDWLSVWGEFNVKEQRWRKAWVEKFGADKQS